MNGEFRTVRCELREGDTLSLAVEDAPGDVSPYTLPADLPLDVLFEDEWVTAVNKPAGMPAHPSHGHRLDTVSNALAFRYSDRYYVFRPVNRLDRDTSGCMLTSNSRDASYKMYEAMTAGKIKKTYIAVADGIFGEKEGRIDAPVARSQTSIITRRVDPSGKPASTGYRVIAEGDGRSLLVLRPLTGRTHQIRVHLSHIGHPVTGDDMYGTRSEAIGRQALHCVLTSFPHPATGETETVFAPLFPDMEELIKTDFPDVDLKEEIL